MDYINTILDIGLSNIAIALIAILFTIQNLVKLKDWFCDRFGIETKRSQHEKKQQLILEKHETVINKVVEDMKEIKELLMQQKKDADDRAVASFRSMLWRIYQESIEKGYITKEGLKTFLESGKLYEAAGGNDIYHNKLHPEILKLPVRDDD